MTEDDDTPRADGILAGNASGAAAALVDSLTQLSASIDDIGTTSQRAAASADRTTRWQKVLVLAMLLVVLASVINIWAVLRLTGQAHTLTDIATTNQDNGRIAAANTNLLKRQQDDILRIVKAVESVTSAEARTASQESTRKLVDGLIADIRRSIDCTALAQRGLVPAPCTDVQARLDALIAGVDPFTQPPG